MTPAEKRLVERHAVLRQYGWRVTGTNSKDATFWWHKTEVPDLTVVTSPWIHTGFLGRWPDVTGAGNKEITRLRARLHAVAQLLGEQPYLADLYRAGGVGRAMTFKAELDPLVEMHLLLRGHGWEPELKQEQGETFWEWSLAGLAVDVRIETMSRDSMIRREEGTLWFEMGPEQHCTPHRTVDSLRKRLKELSRPDPAESTPDLDS